MKSIIEVLKYILYRVKKIILLLFHLLCDNHFNISFKKFFFFIQKSDLFLTFTKSLVDEKSKNTSFYSPGLNTIIESKSPSIKANKIKSLVIKLANYKFILLSNVLFNISVTSGQI